MTTTWYQDAVDPLHIVGYGFRMTLSQRSLELTDEDADPPPPVVRSSVWGVAKHHRATSSYKFEPLVFSGTELWFGRNLSVPPVYALQIPADTIGGSHGGYVSTVDVPHLDVIEAVFLDKFPARPPDRVYMAQILVDLSREGPDPFTTVATRVIEPLMSELRSVVAAVGHLGGAFGDLATQVARLEDDVRRFQSQPSRLRSTIRGGLQAITAIVLGIAANRIDDALAGRIDWATLLNVLHDAARRLGLG